MAAHEQILPLLPIRCWVCLFFSCRQQKSEKRRYLCVCVSMGKQVIAMGLWRLSWLCYCLSILTKPGIPSPFCHSDLSRRPGLISSKNALVKKQSDSNNPQKRTTLTRGTLLLGSRSVSLMGCQGKQGVWVQLVSQTVGCRQKECEGTLFLCKSPSAPARYWRCRVCTSSVGARVGCWIPGKDLPVVIWTHYPNEGNSHR